MINLKDISETFAMSIIVQELGFTPDLERYIKEDIQDGKPEVFISDEVPLVVALALEFLHQAWEMSYHDILQKVKTFKN
jgi:hypothetical protein